MVMGVSVAFTCHRSTRRQRFRQQQAQGGKCRTRSPSNCRNRSPCHEPRLLLAEAARSVRPLPRRRSTRRPIDFCRSCSPLECYTLRGYMGSMHKDIKASTLKRLNRIEGQVRGVTRMIEEDRYCVDVLTQTQAIRAALVRVESQVLKEHMAHCIEGAIVSGNASEQRKKAAELIELLERAAR